MKHRDYETMHAVIYSAAPPTHDQMVRFWAFLDSRYPEEIELTWQPDPQIQGGFMLKAGMDVYDWSLEGRLRKLRREIDTLPSDPSRSLISLLQEHLQTWTPDIEPEEIGTVESVGDGIAHIKGLYKVKYGEILQFESGIKGMVQDLRKDKVSCIIFGDEDKIAQGGRVFRTGKEAGVPVGDDFVGRVVNALGEPIDGAGPIQSEHYRPIEAPAPGIIDRESVNQPLETGLLTIDSMFPIGRGQRELIIGDRQTGKTTIALDTILNQKGKGVICIYVAIGQKNSSVAQLVETLRKNGAMEYTIVVNASASESIPMIYIAPYAGCAMGEYFMHEGRDVLIVYDDLSKHAVAYRAMSLLLERSPGREAYPGDVFYLHSRLLERAAHLSSDLGGGSMTALPIVETQAGDVSAYIPTNIISITDGQIFLETDLFFSGQRPAVNVGLSVSRVGSAAQTKAMKNAAKGLKLALSQYREMEVFTQFSSDMDEGTKRQLQFGRSLLYLMRQPQHKPLRQSEMVVLLLVGMDGCFATVPVKQIQEKASHVLAYFERNHAKLLREIDQTGRYTEEERELILREAAKALSEEQV